MCTACCSSLVRNMRLFGASRTWLLSKFSPSRPPETPSTVEAAVLLLVVLLLETWLPGATLADGCICLYLKYLNRYNKVITFPPSPAVHPLLFPPLLPAAFVSYPPRWSYTVHNTKCACTVKRCYNIIPMHQRPQSSTGGSGENLVKKFIAASRDSVAPKTS